MTDGRARAAPILVIKLGALGDFVQAMGPAAAIRAQHRDAEITLLTTEAFAELGRKAPYFDAVWLDDRPRFLRPIALLQLRHRLRRAGFARIYDLQTSDRSSFYFHLMGPGARPEWSGVARGASHPHDNPERNRMHTLDRQADQLRSAGIASVPPPDLAWAAEDVARFRLGAPYLLLVPGGSAHRPGKRWPVERYAALALLAVRRGLRPVVLGGESERRLGAAIAGLVPEARDLTGQTRLGEIVGLAREARYAIGNDTGPMHVIAASGAPATVLYSDQSDPALTAPRGPGIRVLQRVRLADLAVEEVAATLPMG